MSWGGGLRAEGPPWGYRPSPALQRGDNLYGQKKIPPLWGGIVLLEGEHFIDLPDYLFGAMYYFVVPKLEVYISFLS